MSNWWKANKNQTSIHGAALYVRQRYLRKRYYRLRVCGVISNSHRQDSQKWLSHVAQAADSERKTRWKRGPVNWTPT
jgi:hypothetical protein